MYCVLSQDFYREYHSHRISDLEVVHSQLRQQKNTDGLIFLAGDSSLDNKYWFSDTAPALNGFEEFLTPATSKRDVAYWMNKQLAYRKEENNSRSNMAVINCAVEESTIASRAHGALLPQDVFIRDHLTSEDTLVISLGGNDIALRPSPFTVCNMLALVCCTTTGCIEGCSRCGEQLAVLLLPPSPLYCLWLGVMALALLFLRLGAALRPPLLRLRL